jgi:hypothetical protein
MNPRILGILLVALGAPYASDLAAQETAVVPGTDVRLVVSSQEIRGSLMSWDPDTLRVQDPASGFVHVVPSLAIERLRVSEPRTRGGGALRGLRIGSIVGALSFSALFVASEVGCTSWCFNSVGEAFLVGAALGGGLGAGAGAGVGAVWPGTRWVDAKRTGPDRGGHP